MTHIAYIALGSNVGDRRGHLDGAVAAFRDHDAINVCRVSTWIETDPVGGPAGQGQFLNGAAELATTLSPHELLTVLQSIETHFGRVRGVPHGPRTLDLDLLLYDAAVIDEPQLTIPHPRLHERRFVLAPLAEIAPTVRHPILNASIAELFTRLNENW